MAFIEMANGKGTVIVDDDDYEFLSKFPWRRSTQGRPITNIRCLETKKRKTVLLHKLIFSVENGLYVDHINGNFLDNRKSNLRQASPQQNQWNRKCGKMSKTGIKGVGFCKKSKKWRVSMFFDGRYNTIGRFDCIGIAIKKYNEAARQKHGAFARLNGDI
jgi:hypothetical protein